MTSLSWQPLEGKMVLNDIMPLSQPFPSLTKPDGGCGDWISQAECTMQSVQQKFAKAGILCALTMQAIMVLQLHEDIRMRQLAGPATDIWQHVA